MYFQVSFTAGENSDDAYFLLQRQFESYDRGFFYVESHERTLCGHFKITRAELGRNIFRLEWGCEPAGRRGFDSRLPLHPFQSLAENLFPACSMSTSV